MRSTNVPAYSNCLIFVILLVSKTTKELILQWKEHKGVDISSEVKMPQFEISRVSPSKCQENFHIGEFEAQ